MQAAVNQAVPEWPVEKPEQAALSGSAQRFPSPSRHRLERVIVRDEPGFAALADEWNALLARSAQPTVFMRWEWHHTWWQVYARRNDTLHIITWRRDGELVGLLPVYRQICHLIPGRVCLRLIGTGEPKVDEVVTEYGELLADPGMADDIESLAADYLLQFSEWLHIEMSCLLDDSMLLRALLRAGPRSVRLRDSGLRYRVSLQDDFLATLEPSRLKRIRRSQRAAARDGGLVATPVESEAGFEQAFVELAELNHERQAHKRRKSVFASRRFREFHHRLSRQLFGVGAANIIRCHLGSRLLAVLYCFYDDTTCYYYQSGFARRDANRYMPLTLAHLMEMQKNRDHGRVYYDFMRGEIDSYKDQFNGETHAMVDISVYRWQWQWLLATGYRRLRSAVAGLRRWRAQGSNN